MLVIQRPVVEPLPSREQNRQKFSIGPLECGFGHTIGNSLRRTLLSAIPGAAVIQVRFDDAIQEFGTIRGVATDITDIILNLKDLVLRVFCEEPVTLRLDVRGPSDVLAADIQQHPDVEILNTELPIADIDGNDRLAMDITVSRGWGYASADTNKESTVAIGVIPVDSIFSPVRRVAFEVGATRVAQASDYDLLTLDVETDGSISPLDALASAGATLRSLVQIVEEVGDEPLGLKIPEPTPPGLSDDGMDIPLEDLEFKERARNCLKRAEINTLGELLDRTKQDLLQISNFGDKSLAEVVEKLHERGLSLRDEIAPVPDDGMGAQAEEGPA